MLAPANELGCTLHACMISILCNTQSMQKRSSKQGINQFAAQMVRETAGIELGTKNPAAVALGRRGGLKGGKARAEKLTPERRKAIAKKAANARWRTS